MLRSRPARKEASGNCCFPGAVRNNKIWLATKLNMIPNICMPSLYAILHCMAGDTAACADRRVRYVLPIGKRPAYCGPLVLHSDVCTVDRLSVLDRLQNTDITKMHGKRLQWVLLQNHQIRPFSRTQASFASFLKILVCRIDGHGAQSIQDRERAPAAPAPSPAL